MIRFKKIRAGALQFVLFIGTIIAVMLMAFVLLTHTHSLFDRKTDLTVDLIQAVDRGMARSFRQDLASGQVIGNGDENGLGIQIEIKKEYWGVLEKRSVTAKKGKLKFTKTGFVGHGDENRYALYLKENQRPMVIVGDAMVTGDAHLPQRGIKMGNVQGYGYTRPKLIYGRIFRSGNGLPELKEGVQLQLDRLTDTGHVPKGDGMDLEKDLVATNSFLNGPKVIQGEVIDLAEISLSGNFMVWASGAIRVHPSALLEDVVLVAPQIEILDKVVGNFQAIASNRILVGADCVLNYPTVLAVQRPKISSQEQNVSISGPLIKVGRGSRVSGTVLYRDDNVHKGNAPYINLDADAMIMGEVHCDQNLELKGRVLGSVVTNAFVANENGNVYMNHLYQGRIDVSLLPGEYGGLVYEENSANRVMKWLY